MSIVVISIIQYTKNLAIFLPSQKGKDSVMFASIKCNNNAYFVVFYVVLTSILLLQNYSLLL